MGEPRARDRQARPPGGREREAAELEREEDAIEEPAAGGRARLPIPGARLAHYYYVVTKATLAGLVRYLRTGTPQTWDKAKGTR